MEGNPKSSFHSDRSTVFCGGLELPLCNGFAGELIEAIIDATQHAHRSYRAIGEDDGMEDDSAANILPHQFQRISGIDFASGDRR